MTYGRRHHTSILLATGVLLFARCAAAQTEQAPRCGTGVHEEEAVGPVLVPRDQIFCSTISDPKELWQRVHDIEKRDHDLEWLPPVNFNDTYAFGASTPNASA